jgi:Carboxypeptidase regulatory-like domain
MFNHLYSMKTSQEKGGQAMRIGKKSWLLSFIFFVVFSAPNWAQNTTGSLTGLVTDPSGAVVTNAEIELTAVSTGVVTKTVSNADGLYSFQNLPTGGYELRVTAPGFREFLQKGIKIVLNERARIDVKLELGEQRQVVEVQADASPLNTETAEVAGGIAPETVNELPLIMTNNGGMRSAATFMTLLPGVTAGIGGDVIGSHFNGAQRYSGENLVNGASSINPSGGNGTFNAAYDFGQSPEMTSELRVLTSNYEPQYGSTGGAIFIMETKSGTNQIHGDAYYYGKNDALNASPWNQPRPTDREHNFGGSIGGPAKLPLLWSSKNKTYYFFNFEGFRQSGGVSRALLTIPSMQERQGDFRDWVDSDGNLIPIYDPDTLRSNPAYNPDVEVGPTNLPYLRDQFMGCDGKTPNVICPDKIQNSLAQAWFKYLPTPTFPGPKNNFIALDEPGSFYNHTNHFTIRVDEYLGDKDRFFVTIYHRKAGPMTASELPKEISNQSNVYKDPWMNRLNWDHTFSPVLLNHFVGGYQDDMYHGGSLAAGYADLFPKIPGTSRNVYPPTMNFSDDFQSFKSDTRGGPETSKNPAPAYVFTDMLTWVKGKHTFKMGAEYRTSANSMGWTNGEAGTFSFARGETGLLGIDSGSPVASFLLEQVDSASVHWEQFGMISARNQDYITHFGDTWKVTPKFTLNLGLRWEIHPPYHEVHDLSSFFDPYGPNPGAGGRPGRLTFAGTRWGDVSYGKSYPEYLFKKAFSPRLGIAYSVTPKTVVRTGYGIFYDAGIVPGWSGGMDSTGFNLWKEFGSSNGGLSRAAILSEGLPTDYQKPPILDPSYVNGQSPAIYRPFDANRLPYSQQWNLTIEREFTPNFTISAGYVGTKGTRLYSRTAPINVLDPKLLSMGNQLYDEFQPGQTELDGVKIPYAGWVEQMTGCAPSVAQALLPYPQYCGSIQGNNENAGNSTFHSFQLKVEKRWSQGLWFLGSYTLAKSITDAESTQADELTWNGSHAVISPFERQRNKGLSIDDVPQTLVLSGVYDLPFGKGQRWLANTNPVVNALLGGWRISSIFRANSGTPFWFRNYNVCNVPGQFVVGCIPALLPGAEPWAQDKSNFDPNKPLFTAPAFEPVGSFNFYYGAGPRVSNLRGFGYTNQDFSVTKSFPIKEHVKFQLRADAFNIWNWHHFANSIDTDISSSTFGMMNGTATTPRYIQVVGKVNF